MRSTSDSTCDETSTVAPRARAGFDPARVAHAERVETRGGFVEQQHLGPAEQRLREARALRESLRESVDGFVQAVAHAGRLGDRVDLAHEVRAVETGERGVYVQEALQRHGLRQAQAFGQIADAASRRRVEGIETPQPRRAARGPRKAEQQAQRGGLPAPFAPSNPTEAPCGTARSTDASAWRSP